MFKHVLFDCTCFVCLFVFVLAGSRGREPGPGAGAGPGNLPSSQLYYQTRSFIVSILPARGCAQERSSIYIYTQNNTDIIICVDTHTRLSGPPASITRLYPASPGPPRFIALGTRPGPPSPPGVWVILCVHGSQNQRAQDPLGPEDAKPTR